MAHLIADPRVKYKLKWNVPITDVEIVEYGPGVNVTGSAHRTTISYSKEGESNLIKLSRGKERE